MSTEPAAHNAILGKRIVVTRALHQASALTEKLQRMGADVIEISVIKFVAPDDYAPIDTAILRPGGFDWIIFTSANGVEWFVRRLSELGRDLDTIAGAKIGAIGPKTASALKNLKLIVDYVPTEYVAEAVLSQFPEDVSGKSILIPRALEARDELPEGLSAKGAEVVVAPVYQTVTDDSHTQDLRRVLSEGKVGMITFTSASTVTSFLAIAGEVKVPKGVSIACIGPITADAARAHGLEPDIIAKDYTIEGLVRAITG